MAEITKFDAPWRLKELKPEETLRRIGLRENDVFCDIGAGSGIFLMEAVKITRNKIFAVEVDNEMLSILEQKMQSANISNIELIKGEDDLIKIPDYACDITLLSCVLHELKNIDKHLDEIKRISKTNSKIAVIEFHKRKTPMGPPVEHRIEQKVLINQFKDIGFSLTDEFILGENYYCLVFKMSNK